MRPVFAKILNDINHQTFSIKQFSNSNFSTEFHFHHECQINLVLESTGKRIVGDSIDGYEIDEITFLGSDLPHVWHTHADALGPKGSARSITLFFDPDKLISAMKHFVDPERLVSFLQISRRGLVFKKEVTKQLKPLISAISQSEGFKQVALFLTLMDIMIHTKEYVILSSAGFQANYSANDPEKMDNIIRFMFENYHREISLDEISVIANMTKQAFCRYFKNRTQKSFIQFLNEIRISYSCQMINQGDELIGNIAYSCGFSSLSNFNKTFKSIKKITPSQYKNRLSAIRDHNSL